MHEYYWSTNNRREVKEGLKVKRKAEYNTAEKTSKTPKKNLKKPNSQRSLLVVSQRIQIKVLTEIPNKVAKENKI